MVLPGEDGPRVASGRTIQHPCRCSDVRSSIDIDTWLSRSRVRCTTDCCLDLPDTLTLTDDCL